MLFGKKNKQKCEGCGGKFDKDYSYCPHCGSIATDLIKEKNEYGLLGKNDLAEPDSFENGVSDMQGFGLTDKLINSMFNAVMKSLDKQMKAQFKEQGNDLGNAEIKAFPNGFRIKISGPIQMPKKNRVPRKNVEERAINENMMEKINSLPREKAKATMKRLGGNLIYELITPGIISVDDVLVTKTESGYEIKAITDDKVYVNSVSIDLPLKKYSIVKNRLLFEFFAGN